MPLSFSYHSWNTAESESDNTQTARPSAAPHSCQDCCQIHAGPFWSRPSADCGQLSGAHMQLPTCSMAQDLGHTRYLRHVERDLLLAAPQDFRQQLQRLGPRHHVLLLHLVPHRVCLLPVAVHFCEVGAETKALLIGALPQEPTEPQRAPSHTGRAPAGFRVRTMMAVVSALWALTVENCQ